MLFFGIEETDARNGEIPDGNLYSAASVRMQSRDFRGDGNRVHADLCLLIYGGIRRFDLMKAIAVISTGREKDIGICFPFGKEKGHLGKGVFNRACGGEAEHLIRIGKRARGGKKLDPILHKRTHL